ncbi:unnamed protein product [Peronospora belbahrii]|nr:unnamed protein product [Peronospora belbahrii]CAH0478748.1 unnamed protein product [Peronospora belbahrii]
MMQEILELLAMDSSNNSPEQSASTANSCTDRNTRHDSLGTEFDRSSAYGSSNNESMNEAMKKIVDCSCADDVEAPKSYSVKTTSTENEKPSGEKKPSAEQRDVQPRAESAAVDLLPQQTQMQDPIPRSLMPLARDASTRLPVSSDPSYATIQQIHAGDAREVSTAFETDPPPASMSVPSQIAALASEKPSSPRSSTVVFSPKKKSSSMSKVLPTGQRVHLMNSAEFNELRRKLRMQTASRRYRKRRKEQIRHQKMQIQELQSELAHLHEYESQWKQYQQRSVTSLQTELKTHENEVASLTKTIQDAAKEELDWVELMSDHLRKKRDSASNDHLRRIPEST